MKYNEENAIKAITNVDNKSVKAVLREIGMSDIAGGNYQLIYQTIEKHNLDTSHWLGQAINKNKQLGFKRPVLDYLDNKQTINSHSLKLRLFSEKIKEEKCERCNNSKWLDVRIPLELHHIDGNHLNNNLSNLQILCPNCHALTPNFSKDKPKNKPIDEKIIIDTIIVSYSFAEVLRKLKRNCHGRAYDRIKKIKEKYNLEFLKPPERMEEFPNPHWRTEPRFYKRKVTRPSKEELEKMLWEMPVIKIAGRFGITDNSIRGWIKRYRITNIPPQGYWTRRSFGYSHEEALVSQKRIRKPMKIFTKDQIIEIRKLIKEDYLSLREIAKIYNVGHPTISDIKNEKSYKQYLEPSVMELPDIPVLEAGAK